MSAEILHVLLAGFVIVMFVLAMHFLSRRSLTRAQIAAWGLFALFIPVLGPFPVILARPGAPRPLV